MEMAELVDVLLGLVIAGGGFWVTTMAKEVKRLEILLNKTREDYATKFELRDDMRQVMDALHRVEDKLDKVLSRE
jgi:hypothetical protein